MKEQIQKDLEQAVKKAGYDIPVNFSIETPPKAEMGDYASNIAMMLGGESKENPKTIAEKIAEVLKESLIVDKTEIAGPGFINIFIRPELYEKAFEEIIQQKENYGKSSEGSGKKIQVEYISANPTGPLHVGNARGGPIGEALAGLYSFLGYQVEREFYINDIGGQIDRFAETLYYWFVKKDDSRIEFPEGGYKGSYIEELSNKIQEDKKKEISELKNKDDLLLLFRNEGLYHIIKSIREDSELLGIKFDNWVNQSDFEHSGSTEAVIKKLEEIGAVSKKEGALWFKNPEDPDMVDRESVLKKSDEGSTLTYFADDIAYHTDKFDRGFDRIIDVWGANHFGHIPRLKAALKTLGYPEDKLTILLYQFVRLKNEGEVLSMSKRAGNVVTLREVIESGVHPDAFKYFILSQNPNTPFDFDLALAKDTSEKNPVFYVKYAHARIASILRKARVEQGNLPEKDLDFALLKDPKEKALYKELVKFPEILQEIKTNFQIQSLPHFAYKIAGLFHDFYANCQVLSEDKKLTASRIGLVFATKYVLQNSLNICRIDAPDQM